MVRFLLGVLVGIIATVYFFQTGGSDYLISSSPKVRHLEEKLQQADQHQESLAKRLEEATAVIEKMTAQFAALEQRFQALTLPQTTPPAEKPPTSEQPAPPTPGAAPEAGVEAAPSQDPSTSEGSETRSPEASSAPL